MTNLIFILVVLTEVSKTFGTIDKEELVDLLKVKLHSKQFYCIV